MNSRSLVIGLALGFGLVSAAFAADYEAAKSRGQCEAGGGIWDQQMEKCVPTHSQRACELSGGVWDAGSSTCGK
jgi:hypothetical protein